MRGSADLPRVFVVEAEFALALMRAEMEWLRSTIDELRGGRLAWDRDELIRGHGSSTDSKEAT